jgi:hypothetical protein
MNILTEDLQKIVAEHEKVLKAHFSDQLLTDLVQRNRKHLLVLLAEHLDLLPIELACQSFHHQSGPGRAPTHIVSKMVRVLLVGWLYGLSLRELEERLSMDMLVRWFVGYGLFEASPDHATLGRFEAWVLLHQRRVYFDSVLTQIYSQYPAQRKQTQIGDTYAMQANAARQGPVTLWRQFSLRVLEAATETFPNLGKLVSGLDWSGLFGVWREKHGGRLSDAERAERLSQTALVAQDLHQRLTQELANLPQTAQPALRQALDYLRKVLDDEITINGSDVAVRKEKGSYCIGSASDPQASFRNHGERAGELDITLGYNSQVAATIDGLITETQAHTGATPDQKSITKLVTVQKDCHNLCPPKLIYDKAGGSGKVRHEVAEASAGETILSAPLLDYASRSARFGPYDFDLSEDGTTLTCPQGKSTSVAYHADRGDGRNFRFFARQCWQGQPPARMNQADLSCRCRLWEQCRVTRQGPRNRREVFISDYRSHIETAQIYQQTDEARRDRQLRPRIERVIAELVRYNGARRCRRAGLVPADWQAKMSATAYNLKWWMRRVVRAPA